MKTGSTKRLLIVDDDKSISTILSVFFKKHGYSVEVAAHGQEACEIFKAEIFPVVISDYMMPLMDGMELLKNIRSSDRPELSSCYFIMLTAKSDLESLVEGFERGVDDYIGKPFENVELRARVEAGFRLYELQQQLRKVLAKKDELLGIVAHDLRNPISVISSVTELFELGELGELTGEVSEMVGIIRSSVVTLLELINDLVDLSAIESGGLHFEYEQVEATDLIRPEFDKFSPQATAKNIHFELVTGSAETVSADIRRVRGVLANFLSNAVKYSRPGDTVTLSHERSGDFVRFNVHDTGLGIPEAEIGKIFTKFSNISTRPTAGESSSGLGLAICKSVVEVMGGQIGVESVQGQGSTFWFTLPAHNV